MNPDYYIGFFIGLALTIIATFCYVLFFILRSLRLSNSGSTPMQHDLTNMMILFQTMRDTLEQQKSLARRFNRTIDAKVNEIRALTQSSEGLDERVKALETDLESVLDQAREELNSMRRRWEYLQEQLPDQGEDEPSAKTVESHVVEPVKEDFSVPVQEDAPPEAPPSVGEPEVPAATNGKQAVQPLRVLPAQEVTSSSDALESWTGLDFGGNDFDDEDDQPLAELEPLEPEEPEAARDAFRTLLNMDQPTMDPNPPVQVEEEYGISGITPVQQRIYEYSDAGMRVPEIARELGVGKGEVRLILSLRKDKTA